MKVDFISAERTGRNPTYILEFSRTEAMDLIGKLANALTPYSVNRFTVEAGTQPEMSYPLNSFEKTRIGDILFSVNITEGYLSGDSISKETHYDDRIEAEIHASKLEEESSYSYKVVEYDNKFYVVNKGLLEKLSARIEPNL